MSRTALYSLDEFSGGNRGDGERGRCNRVSAAGSGGGGGLDSNLASRYSSATMEKINYVLFCTFALFLLANLIDSARPTSNFTVSRANEALGRERASQNISRNTVQCYTRISIVTNQKSHNNFLLFICYNTVFCRLALWYTCHIYMYTAYAKFFRREKKKIWI